MNDCTTACTYSDEGLYHWLYLPSWGTVPLGCTYPDEALYHWVVPTLMRDCTTGCTYPHWALYHWVVHTQMRDCTTGLYLPWWGTVPLGCTHPDEGLYHWVAHTLIRDCTNRIVPTLMRDCTTVLLRSSERKATSDPRAPTACSNDGELSVSTTVSNAAANKRTAFMLLRKLSIYNRDDSIIYQIRLIVKMLSRCIRYINLKLKG